jgi:hypothetical protein
LPANAKKINPIRLGAIWARYPRGVGFSVLFREDSAMTPTPVDLHATPEAYYPKNYGDTSSNTDIRCGLEGVGTQHAQGANLQGHAARPLERPRGRRSTSFRERTTVAMHNGDLSLRDVRDILEQAKPSRKAFLEAAPSPQLRPPNQAIAAHRNKNLRTYINIFLSSFRHWCAR